MKLIKIGKKQDDKLDLLYLLNRCVTIASVNNNALQHGISELAYLNIALYLRPEREEECWYFLSNADLRRFPRYKCTFDYSIILHCLRHIYI